MIISDSKRFICFCPQKAGFTTLVQALGEFDDHASTFEKMGHCPGSNRYEYLRHMLYEEFIQSPKWSGREDYFRFAFVRNPYDRLYSSYRTIKKMGSHKTDDQILREMKSSSFSYFAANYFPIAPLHHFTHHEGEKMMDFVGYVERFEEDFKKVCSLLKIDSLELPSRNEEMPASENYRYLKHYDRSSIEAVNETFAKDFEYFGYEILNPADFPDSTED